MTCGASHLAKTERYYWDACAWIGLINKESKKHRELEIIWKAAQLGKCVILTSSLSQVEVFKIKCEKDDPKPLSEENDLAISNMFQQPYVKRVNLDPIVGELARKLRRQHPQLKKVPDAVHLATAMFWNCDALHTYDNADLLGLTLKVSRRDGVPLLICIPDESADGPLFAGPKDIQEPEE